MSSKQIRPWRTFGIAAAFAGAVMLSPVANAAPEKKDLKIGYATMSGAFAAFWIAEAKGYFKEEGLNVELLYTQGSVGIQALSSGHMDAMATGCVEFFEANRKGYANKIVANYLEGNQYALVTPKNTTKAEQLIGKAIAVNSIGDTSYLSLRYALRMAGVDPDKVTYVEMGSTPERFSAVSRGSIAGAVQAVSLRPLAEKQGMNILINLHEMQIPSCLGAFGFRADAVQKYPETVSAVLRALTKANAFFSDGPAEETKAIFSKYLKQPATDENLLMGWSFFSTTGHSHVPKIRTNSVSTVLDMLAEQDPSWKKEAPEKFVDQRFMDEIEKSGYAEKVYQDIRAQRAK